MNRIIFSLILFLFSLSPHAMDWEAMSGKKALEILQANDVFKGYLSEKKYEEACFFFTQVFKMHGDIKPELSPKLVAKITQIAMFVHIYFDNYLSAALTHGTLTKAESVSALKSLPAYSAWLAFSKAAHAALRKYKIVPEVENPFLQIFKFLDGDGPEKMLIIFCKDGNYLTAGSFSNIFTHQAFLDVYPDGSQVDVLLDHGKVINAQGLYLTKSRFGTAMITMYSGLYGFYPYSIAKNSYYPVQSFEDYCAEFGIPYSGTAAFVPFYEDEAERIGFLLEARAWFLEAFPCLAITSEAEDPSAKSDREPELESPEEQELQQEIEQLMLQEEQRIKELQAAKQAEKQQPTKRGGRGGRGGRGAHAARGVSQTNATEETKVLVAEAREDVVKRVNKGRVKFRKVKPLIGKLLTTTKIECRRAGSHIALARDGYAPISVVDVHKRKRDKTLSVGEVETMLSRVHELASTKK